MSFFTTPVTSLLRKTMNEFYDYPDNERMLRAGLLCAHLPPNAVDKMLGRAGELTSTWQKDQDLGSFSLSRLPESPLFEFSPGAASFPAAKGRSAVFEYMEGYIGKPLNAAACKLKAERLSGLSLFYVIVSEKGDQLWVGSSVFDLGKCSLSINSQGNVKIVVPQEAYGEIHLGNKRDRVYVYSPDEKVSEEAVGEQGDLEKEESAFLIDSSRLLRILRGVNFSMMSGASSSPVPIGVEFKKNNPLKNGNVYFEAVFPSSPISPDDEFIEVKRDDGA